MAQDDIQGQVVDPSGNPVSGAIVELTKSFESSPDTRGDVFRTTTDSNGNYIFTGHQEGDGTTQEWHVSAYNHDGTAYVNSFNNPGVTADLPSNAIPDSAVFRQLWDEGTGTTTEDVIGNNDGNLDNVTWTPTARFEGGQALEFNNSAYVDLTNPDFAFTDDLLLAITANFNSLNSNQVLWNVSDGTDAVSYGIERNNDGDFALRDFRDGTSLSESNVFQTSTDFRVAVYFPSDTNETPRAWVNNTELNLPGNNDLSIDTDGTKIGHWFSSEGANGGFDGIADQPIIYKNPSNLTSVVNDDFALQPWS